MIFKTERLTLRPWHEKDAECLHHFAKNPKIGPIAGWPPHKNIEESLNIIKTIFSKKETYAIVLNDIPVGCVGLLFDGDCNHSWDGNCAELGYWIGEEYWGQGLAYEASQVIVNHAFIDLDIEKIYASFNIKNNQSKRVLEKLGFTFFKKLKNTNYLNEEYEEIAMVLEK